MNNAAGLPFDDIRALCRMLPGPDAEAADEAAAREGDLIKEPGSLGDLERLAVWAAGWQGKARPTAQRPLVAIFAAENGVAGAARAGEAGTRARLEAFAAGGAAVSQICAAQDFGLKVFDLALDLPTPDITQDAALDEAACAATMAFGMEAIAGGTDLLCLAAIGRGSDIAATALLQALLGPLPDGERHAGRVAAALATHAGHLADPLEALRRLGGREIAAAAGAILAARLQRIPVVLDGLAVAAAAAVLQRLDPEALQHCVAGHAADATHAAILKRLGLRPLLALGIGADDGVGAALAGGIVKAAILCHVDMATRAQAGWPPAQA